jgi:F-type H+-transporting ATPase subunit b
MDVLHQFGIEPKLLLTQLVNFAIFFFVMWKWILPPVRKMMAERRTQIEEALKAADEAKKEVAAAQAARDEQRGTAKREAAQILEQAKEQAKAQTDQAITVAKEEAGRVLENAQAQITTEQAKAKAELRAEVAALTVETTRKVLTDVVTDADRKRLVKAAETKLKKAKV